MSAPFQPFPTEAPLSDQLDLSLPDLEARVGEFASTRPVYPYVVATVRLHNGEFRQEGGSPNYQGGLITLCDCKPLLRTYPEVTRPEGAWIAGITAGGITPRHRRYLFYLMFSSPVASHVEMWRRLPPVARDAKSAARDRLGDVYEPVALELDGEAAFDPDKYRRPVERHVHEPEGGWRGDITQQYSGGRRPRLLLGDPTFTFIWSRPRIWLIEKRPLPRNPTASDSPSAFLSRLRDEEVSAP